jgi:pimeloyl-ACP methyl ester carboxylesterase
MAINVSTVDSTMAAAPEHYTIGSVTSEDGATIGYRQYGHGPGVVLVQGAMGTAQHFTQLAGALAGAFTVYVPDRRDRGLSGSIGDDYSAQKDVEDLGALLSQTGARDVFGLSSGALIALQAALNLHAIRRVAIYEPPLFINGAPTALMVRYEEEMARDNVAAALTTAMQATQMGPPIFNVLPRWLLERLTNMAMTQEDKRVKGDYPPMRALAPTLRHDFQVVAETSGALALQRFQSVKAEVLLLGGSKSPTYLKVALDTLEKTLPHVRRIELAGLGHAAAWNADRGGKPEQVAQELRQFFEACKTSDQFRPAAES